MRNIDLDASNWRTVLEFYDAVLIAIGAPQWHGRSINALIDSMIWGGINSVDPPYQIRIFGSAMAPVKVREEIEAARQALSQGREYYQKQEGGDVEVSIEIVS